MAIVVVKTDLYGSTFGVGVTSYRYDRVIRRCHVSGLSVSFDDIGGSSHDLLNRASQAAITGNLFHNVIRDLPLQQVRARQHGPTSAWVDLIYARGRWANLPNPSNTIGSYRSKDMPIPVYRNQYTVSGSNAVPAFNPDTHLPNGNLHIIKETNTGRLPGTPEEDFKFKRPQHYTHRRPAVEFFLPTFKSFDPLGNIDHLIGKTNDAPVTIGGLAFATNTLLLKGPNLDWTRNRNGNWFEVDFRLIGMPTGFFVQHVLIAESGVNMGKWVTVDGPEFEQGNFFPLVSIF